MLCARVIRALFPSAFDSTSASEAKCIHRLNSTKVNNTNKAKHKPTQLNASLVLTKLLDAASVAHSTLAKRHLPSLEVSVRSAALLDPSLIARTAPANNTGPVHKAPCQTARLALVPLDCYTTQYLCEFATRDHVQYGSRINWL